MSKLSEQINFYQPLIKRIIDTDQSKYFFTNNFYHRTLIEHRKFAEANKNYVSEIIYHIHAASLITLRRNTSWINSIESSRKNSTYFSYCVSLRGLIESAADSFYSLRYIPKTLSANFNIITRCINGKESKNIHDFKELEDLAIHFFEAGKYENKDLPEEHFKAKSTWEYINALDSEKALKPVYPLYQKLCQIAHPSRDTAYLYFKNRKDIWSVEEIDESEEIKRLEEAYDTEYEETFQKCFNSALLSLWIIDQLPIKELKCAGVRRINFENIGEFQKIKKLISI